MDNLNESFTSQAPSLTFTVPQNAQISVKGDGYRMLVSQDDTKTGFIGEIDNRILPKVIDVLTGTREKLLVDAVNNRTRERNYYQLYSKLLENQISDDDFDREIDENPDEYVVPIDKNPSESDFYQAMQLSEHLKGTDTIGDIESLFSFKDTEVLKHCKKLTNGVL